jgi:SHS2 domain-containing protein
MTARHAQPGHRQLDHTGDVAFELWAPSGEELLREGARAAAELLTGRDGAAIREPPAEHRALRRTTLRLTTLQLTTIDWEDRLVQWLNEVIYLAVYEGLLVVDADFDSDDTSGRGTLSARVRVASLEPGELLTELKSATYHDLRIRRDDDGTWRARIVIDV